MCRAGSCAVRAAWRAPGRAHGFLNTPATLGLILGLCGGLGACSIQMQAGLGTAQAALGWSRSAANTLDTSPLDPALRYLRVQVQGNAGLVVLGDEAPGPLGLTSVWYSADGAVLRLLDGRLVGFADRQRSWAVTALSPAISSPPDWHTVARLGAPQGFEQMTDVQPGYRLGLIQQRERLAQPAAPTGHHARGLPAHAQWFVEHDSGTAVRPAWYAYDLQQQPARLLYGQACLDAQLCLSWQPWPVALATRP